jgi:DNA-directed RNA polymerase delta subunit
LVFKKHGKPLHFTKVAELIDKFNYNLPNKKTYSQTVHNELIKDSRFVLVGRGIYALKEWGYERGYVKDVIFQVLKSAQKPLDKEEILEKVLKQRIVKENTVLLNLSNKNYFLRTSKGNYTIKEA